MLLRSNTLMRQPPEEQKLYVAGIDEIGSETQKSEGWTYFVIPDSSALEFANDAADILSKTKMFAFHGKDFKRRFASGYESFLRLIRKHLEQSSHSLLVTTLLDEAWKSEYSGFVERLIANSVCNTGIADNALVEASQMLAKPLFTFQRLASTFPDGASVRFEVDDHANTRGLVDLQPTKDGKPFSPLVVIETAYKVYRGHKFPSAPEIAKNSTKILPDEQSFIVQAADLVGNLSVAYARQRLGQHSNAISEKVKLFESVFGDILEDFDFAANLELNGGELALKQNGAFTFRVRGASSR